MILKFSSKTKGPGEEGAAGYCPKILLPTRAKMVLCSFHRSHRGICSRNRPLSETKFLDDFWGPLPLAALLAKRVLCTLCDLKTQRVFCDCDCLGSVACTLTLYAYRGGQVDHTHIGELIWPKLHFSIISDRTALLSSSPSCQKVAGIRDPKMTHTPLNSFRIN